MKTHHKIITTFVILAALGTGGYKLSQKPLKTTNNGSKQAITALKPPSTPHRNTSVQTCQEHDGLPDSACTQFMKNQDITQDNLDQTICNPSFRTGSIRPPTSYTGPIKKQKMADYGITDASLVELDHGWAITDGGDPKDPKGLWPELWHENLNGFDVGAKTKDTLEVKVHKLICSHQMTLEDAGKCFYPDCKGMCRNSKCRAE